MTKYAVIYTWKETCYVEADSDIEAQEIADGIPTDRESLGLHGAKVRKATRLEQEVETFEKGEEKPW